MMNGPGRQIGISIIAALFVLVVLAVLGAYMVTISGVQHSTGNLSVQGSRAVFAAQSGMEWAVFDAVHNAAGNLNCGGPPGPPFTLAGGAATGFDVQVTNCTQTVVNEGGVNYNVYEITVRASRLNQNAQGFVSRTIRATVTDGA